jgi:hypothetical protein
LRYFPDEPSTDGISSKAIVLAIPLLYLATALIYSAYVAPWGRQVDPESAYAMNGLVASAGYGSMKFDHPGTTTTLLVDTIIRLWALVSRPEDIVGFGLKHYDTIIYAARTCETIILSCALLVGGFLVRNVTRSSIAAMIFQIGPFVHFDAFHFEMVLIPESLMASSAVLAIALTIKAALSPTPPTVRFGVTSGLVFAFGFSSKYLFLPIAALSVTLLRNRRSFVAACVAGAVGFTVFNLVLNPGAITRGFGWLFSIASHKGIYGTGEPGFIDFSLFWLNMQSILAAAPLICVIYTAAAISSLVRIKQIQEYADPVSIALLAAVFVYAAQLVATSKHFGLHYMMTSWVIVGGVLVLTIIQIRRLMPALSAGALAMVAAGICAAFISRTLFDVVREAQDWRSLDDAGANLSKAVAEAAPTCANVSGMFVRAPEDDTYHGYAMTMAAWGDQAAKDRFSNEYARVFKSPLLDQDTYTGHLTKNFRPYDYGSLASEYRCVVVRSFVELNDSNSSDLLALHPDHCNISGIHVYTVGTACSMIQRAFSDRATPILDPLRH